MSYLINNQQKINEIIFAKRNKTYGAYVIRSAYGATVLKSLSFMLLGFGTIISVAFYMSNRNDIEPNKSDMGQIQIDSSLRIVEYKMKEPEQQQQQQRQENPKQNQQAASNPDDFRNARIVDSLKIETTVVVNSTPSNNTNTTTVEGPTGPSTPSTTGGTGTTTITGTTSTTNTIHSWVDTNPEFEGGLRALYAFIGSKLKYPEPAYGEGKEGTVYVKFVVDETGKVGSLSLLNSVGYGMDQEALRVVGLIPNFKSPGKMGNQPVKVYYQVPIKFRMR